MSALKRWGPWLAMAVIVVIVLVVAGGRSGPRTPAERIDAIARTIRCPTCEGESVYVSQAPSAQDVKEEIARQINAGSSDDQVRAFIAERIGAQYLLTPSASGIGAVAWALPVVVLVLAFAGLGFAFARWRRQLAAPGPDDDDRALVAAAMAADRSRADDQRADDADLDDGRLGEGSGR